MSELNLQVLTRGIPVLGMALATLVGACASTPPGVVSQISPEPNTVQLQAQTDLYCPDDLICPPCLTTDSYFCLPPCAITHSSRLSCLPPDCHPDRDVICPLPPYPLPLPTLIPVPCEGSPCPFPNPEPTYLPVPPEEIQIIPASIDSVEIVVIGNGFQRQVNVIVEGTAGCGELLEPEVSQQGRRFQIDLLVREPVFVQCFAAVEFQETIELGNLRRGFYQVRINDEVRRFRV